MEKGRLKEFYNKNLEGSNFGITDSFALSAIADLRKASEEIFGYDFSDRNGIEDEAVFIRLRYGVLGNAFTELLAGYVYEYGRGEGSFRYEDLFNEDGTLLDSEALAPAFPGLKS